MFSNNSSARKLIPMANKYDRVVLLVDMDCFYCQVEEKLDPSLKGKPIAVVQYNAWRGGGIIAVNYAARAKGVTRHMRGDEAKEKCPDLKLVKVPNVREKADLTKYREAGKDVANVLQRFTRILERASVDEAYLDITHAVNKRLKEIDIGKFILGPEELTNTYAVGFQSIGDFVINLTTNYICNPVAYNEVLHRKFDENDIPAVRQSNIRLLIGASIASEIRKAVKMETSYECSAGIAHNKILAKLACGLNKPNKQTILPLAEIPGLFETLPISKIKGLGAKFGEEICERLKVRYVGQLLKFTEAELQKKFDEKNGTWLYNICRGIDLEAVVPRFYSKSIGCCKKFPGRNSITGIKTLQHWLNELAKEINERLEKDILENNRKAKQMVVNYVQEFDNQEISSSRSAPLQSYNADFISKISLELIKSNTKQFFRAGSESVLNNPIKLLGISVGKFETISKHSQNNIQEMFAQQKSKTVRNVEQQPCNNESSTRMLVKNHSADLLQNEEGVSENISLDENTFSNTIELNIKSQETSNLMNDLKTIQNEVTECSGERTEIVNNTVNMDINEIDMKNHNTFSNTNELNTKSQENFPDNSYSNTIISLKRLESTALKTKEDILEITNSGSILKDENSFSKVNIEVKDRNTKQTSNLMNELRSSQNDVIECSSENKEVVSNTEDINVNEMHAKNHNTFANKNAISTQDEISRTDDSAMNRKRKLFEISGDEMQFDYRHRYAEFAMPELRLEYLQFIDCSKCGIKIFNDPNSIQTHQDLHFAQELSQQQRNEFRKEVQTKINSTRLSPNSFNNKKSKRDQVVNTTVKKSSNASITKFFKPQEVTCSSLQLISDVNQGADYNNSDAQICDICKKPVKLDEILEHKDFHIAKDLQRQLNQLEVHTVPVVKKTSSEVSRKNSNISLNTTSRQNKENAITITKFFNQSNT